MARRTLRLIAIYILIVAKALRLADRPGELITRAEIEAEADRWANRQPRPPAMRSVRLAWLRFTGHATRWLTFLGRLQPPAAAPRPYAEDVAQFADYMLRERGLSPRTVESRCRTISEFLSLIVEAGLRLDTLTVAQVDELLARKVRDEGYARVTIQTYASTLRAFFRYAEGRGWCRPGLAAAIMAPRVFPHEALPAGPSWEDVNRALAAAQGDRPADIRDRALLMLLGGLRPPLRRSRGPAPGGLRLGAGDPDHPAQQAAEAADLPAVPAGRGCRPPLPPGGPAPVELGARCSSPSGRRSGRCRGAAWGRWFDGDSMPWTCPCPTMAPTPCGTPAPLICWSRGCR